MDPFKDFELSSVFSGTKENLLKKIDDLANDEIMANSIDLLAENFVEEDKIVPVIINNEDIESRSMTQAKISVYVDLSLEQNMLVN